MPMMHRLVRRILMALWFQVRDAGGLLIVLASISYLHGVSTRTPVLRYYESSIGVDKPWHRSSRRRSERLWNHDPLVNQLFAQPQYIAKQCKNSLPNK